MLIPCRIKIRGKMPTNCSIEFAEMPHKGDLIQPDEHGSGIHGWVEEVAWVYGDDSVYHPWLIIRAYEMEEYT